MLCGLLLYVHVKNMYMYVIDQTVYWLHLVLFIDYLLLFGFLNRRNERKENLAKVCIPVHHCTNNRNHIIYMDCILSQFRMLWQIYISSHSLKINFELFFSHRWHTQSPYTELLDLQGFIRELKTKSYNKLCTCWFCWWS